MNDDPIIGYILSTLKSLYPIVEWRERYVGNDE
jgi:hypothetical protein